jgi:hypothetical protein
LHFKKQLNQHPIHSGHLLMLPNLLEDGDLSLLRSWHTELDSENLSVLLVSLLMPQWVQFGTITGCAPLLQLLVLKVTLQHVLRIHMLLKPVLLLHLYSELLLIQLLTHKFSSLLFHYGLLEIQIVMDQMELLTLLMLLGLPKVIWHSHSQHQPGHQLFQHSLALLPWLILVHHQLLTLSLVSLEPKLSLLLAPPSSPSLLSTESEKRTKHAILINNS